MIQNAYQSRACRPQTVRTDTKINDLIQKDHSKIIYEEDTGKLP